MEDGDSTALLHALDAAGIGAWTWDAADGRLWLSDRARALVGDGAAADPEDLWARVAGHERERVQAALQRALTDGGDAEVVFALEADGTRHLRVCGRFVVAGDVPPRASGTVQDASERVRTTQAVQAFVRAESVTQVGSWAWDTRTGRITWSEEMRRLMGIDPAETATPDTYLWLVHPEDRDRVRADLQRMLATHEDSVLEFRVAPPDGAVRWLRSRIQWVRDDDGPPARLVGTNQDITETRAAAEARTQAERARRLESLGVMAGGVAHDFNNLLVAILGNASLALEELPEDASSRDLLLEVEDAARAAADLAGQMLAYSGHSRMSTAPLDLDAVVRASETKLAASVAGRVRLRVEGSHRPLPVVGDATQLRKVLENLVTNAAESFDEAHGQVWIRTGARRFEADELARAVLTDGIEPGDYIFVDVADDGPGIPPEVLDRLFDPFFTTKFTGRGLGLAVVLGVLRSHDGTVLVHSEPGQGTRFTVLLPATRQLTEVAALPQAPARWRGEGTILLVDDEASVLTVAKRMLERLGYEVLTADGSARGLELFTHRQADLVGVILDLTMPGMDGVALCEEIRARSQDTVILISSGYPHTDVERRMGGARPDGFLQKPYTLPRMRAALQAAFDEHRTASG